MQEITRLAFTVLSIDHTRTHTHIHTHTHTHTHTHRTQLIHVKSAVDPMDDDEDEWWRGDGWNLGGGDDDASGATVSEEQDQSSCAQYYGHGDSDLNGGAAVTDDNGSLRTDEVWMWARDVGVSAVAAAVAREWEVHSLLLASLLCACTTASATPACNP